MRRPTRERLQEIREAPYKSLEEFDLFAEIDGLTHDLTMLDLGCDAVIAERDKLKKERDKWKEKATHWQPEEIEMARIEGEKLWLTLGDKESFAREAEAKGRLWHAAREENEELKNKLKEARAETRKYQRADDGFSALASKFGQEVDRLRKILKEIRAVETLDSTWKVGLDKALERKCTRCGNVLTEEQINYCCRACAIAGPPPKKISIEHKLKEALEFCVEHGNANEPLSKDTLEHVKRVLKL